MFMYRPGLEPLPMGLSIGSRDSNSLAACNSETSTLGGDSNASELSCEQREEPATVPGSDDIFSNWTGDN